MNAIRTRVPLIVSLIFVGICSTACGQDDDQQMKPEDTEWYEPVPPVVQPADDHFMSPPSDAIVLFDGSDLSKWESVEGGEAKWDVQDGYMTIRPGTGSIQTRDSFGSFQLYLEWRSPTNTGDDTGQDKGNSGVFLQSRYEVQVLDAYQNKTYVNGMAGSIYKQTAPLVNPAQKPGDWQSYNISYTAPEFNDDGSLKSPAYVTVIWNGVVVQNNYELKGHTPYIGLPEYTAHGDAPIMLQDHNSRVSYRNIWIRPLD